MADKLSAGLSQALRNPAVVERFALGGHRSARRCADGARASRARARSGRPCWPVSSSAPNVESITPAISKPNFLFLMADQLTAFALRMYGNGVCRTPNLDRLAARSTRFANIRTAISAVRAVAWLC